MEDVMTNIRTAVPLILTLTALVGLNACSGDDPTGTPTDDQVALLSVSPTGGMTNVDPGSPVTIGFEHSMRDGSEAYCALHLGDLNGIDVPGHWEWSEDHHRLTFTPDQPFEHAHEYTIHVGGGMEDEHGHHMDFEQHGQDMGGNQVEGHMVGPGSGMHAGHDHSGDGWQHPDGTFGMSFTFSTSP
jgi:hypothetical protein